MKYYKCVKAWSRHGVGTTINEWEYTKLPINIKSGHFQETVVSNDATVNATIVNTPTSTIWENGNKTIDLNVPLPDDDKVQLTVNGSSTDATSVYNTVDYSVANPTDMTTLAVQPNAPLTTFSSGNKFKDKLKSSKNEDNI